MIKAVNFAVKFIHLQQRNCIISSCSFFFASKPHINTACEIFLFSLAGALLASILHLYPFVSRLILFLLPFEILFIAQCFDFKIVHKKMRIIFSSIVIILVMTTLLLFQAKIICKNRIKTLVGFNHSVYSKCYLKHSVATCLNVLS